MIKISDLCLGYHEKLVLRNINLEIRASEILCVIGPNGSGKSTLIQSIAGLLKPVSGSIELKGAPLGQYSNRQRAQLLAYLPQSRTVPDISVRRLVLHGRFPYLSYPRRYRSIDFTAAEDAMEQADVLAFADRQLPDLSGGQRQSAYFALALAQETPIILMDEPTTYLDIDHQLKMMDLSREMSREGKTVVMILHDLCAAMKIADRIAVLDEGSLQFSGTPEELFRSDIIKRVFHVELGRVSEQDKFCYYYK